MFPIKSGTKMPMAFKRISGGVYGVSMSCFVCCTAKSPNRDHVVLGCFSKAKELDGALNGDRVQVSKGWFRSEETGCKAIRKQGKRQQLLRQNEDGTPQTWQAGLSVTLNLQLPTLCDTSASSAH